MSISKDSIHLAIAFDEKYLTPFYALLASVFLNNKENKIVIHSIATGISEEEKEKIRKYVAQHGGEIHYYSIDQNFVSRFVLTSKWTSAVYYRLFFPFLVPDELETLLYIDTDTLVINDLREFWKIDLQDYPVAAAYDNWVKVQPDLGITDEGNYFNSGVLYINLKQWREQKISEKAFDYLINYPEKIKFVDQDALNAVLIGNWVKISNRFNLIYSMIPEDLARKDFQPFLANKVILHFTLERPWHMLCKNRFRYLYHEYLRKSPRWNEKKYVDFSFSHLSAFLKIRMREVYFDNPGIASLWRKVKKLA